MPVFQSVVVAAVEAFSHIKRAYVYTTNVYLDIQKNIYVSFIIQKMKMIIIVYN